MIRDVCIMFSILYMQRFDTPRNCLRKVASVQHYTSSSPAPRRGATPDSSLLSLIIPRPYEARIYLQYTQPAWCYDFNVDVNTISVFVFRFGSCAVKSYYKRCRWLFSDRSLFTTTDRPVYFMFAARVLLSKQLFKQTILNSQCELYIWLSLSLGHAYDRAPIYAKCPLAIVTPHQYIYNKHPNLKLSTFIWTKSSSRTLHESLRDKLSAVL